MTKEYCVDLNKIRKYNECRKFINENRTLKEHYALECCVFPGNFISLPLFLFGEIITCCASPLDDEDYYAIPSEMEGNNIGLTFTDTEIAGYGYNCWIRFNEENSTSEQVRIPWNEVTGVRIISFPKRNSGALTIPDFFEINNTLFILHQKNSLHDYCLVGCFCPCYIHMFGLKHVPGFYEVVISSRKGSIRAVGLHIDPNELIAELSQKLKNVGSLALNPMVSVARTHTQSAPISAAHATATATVIPTACAVATPAADVTGTATVITKSNSM